MAMRFDKFTEKAQEALVTAQSLAKEQHHGQVEAEHLLLALLSQSDGIPAAVLGARSTAEDAFPVVFYATALTITSASLTATWLYAVRRELLDPSLSTAETAAVSRSNGKTPFE